MTDPHMTMPFKNAYSLWGANKGEFTQLGTYSSLAKLKRAWTEHHAYPNVGSLQARVMVDGTSSIINDQMPLLVLKEFRSAEERDAHIIENAKYFTVVRFLGVGRYERHERITRKEAEELAEGLSDRNKANYMIYAVGPNDLAAFVRSYIYQKRGKP